MLEQPVDRKRCASCERWQGPRQPAASPTIVLIESEISTGLCRGGPWDNSERRARSACGHWTRWSQLPTEGEMTG
ncbi:hypothetical protein [Dechloromonas sp.]|uniref:hypothetical protein n=1 Tax=Dechloromonas sp. TaxID=1917218 RepID=UPI0012155841|nr:hypothetical protein [Dechloromonas sp.]MBU3697938.1 hypothetical protein [Dechloromonas sp.]TEX50035.1 MAG: hypothetical protein CFR70_00435 [Rhodocyclaceae bacterium]